MAATVFTLESLSSLTYRELQTLAKSVGVRANGKRDELASRIVEHAVPQVQYLDFVPSAPVPAEVATAQDSATLAPAACVESIDSPAPVPYGWDRVATPAPRDADVYDPSPAELAAREDAEWRDYVPETNDSAPPAGSEWRKVEERAAELEDSLSVLILTAADSRTAHDWLPTALVSLLLQWRDWDAPALLLACERITGRRIECRYDAERALGQWARNEFLECVRGV